MCLQHTLLDRLRRDKDSEVFFRVFYQYMFDAQTEIKNTIMVSTAEVLSEKKVEERDRHAPAGLLPRQRGNIGLIILPCFL